jgi:hypothetical protein
LTPSSSNTIPPCTACPKCARTLRALRALGARHFCICNLPTHETWATLSAILEKAGLP